MPYTLIPDLASRAEVPEAGTLSRVLHQDERVRLVLFAFDAGEPPSLLALEASRLLLTMLPG